MSFNDDIFDGFVARRVDLASVEPAVQARTLAQLRLLEKDIERIIKQINVAGAKRSTFKMRRMSVLLKQVRQSISTHYRGAAATLKEELVVVARAESAAIAIGMNQAAGFNWMNTGFTQRELTHVVTNSLIEGSPAADWWGKQSLDLVRRFEGQARLGYLAGESNDDIVRRIRGKATGRRITTTMADGSKVVTRETVGGIMKTSRREATALVRTAVQKAANDVAHATYLDNDDVIGSEMAVATLDDRTTEICIARDGGIWDIKTGEATPDSITQESFPGPPPWHFNCRTILVPIVKPLDSMSKKQQEAFKKNSNSATRASMDGQIPGNVKYGEWLRAKEVKTPGFADSVLGKTKAKLWRSGKITPQQLINKQGRPLTVKELLAKHGTAKKKPTTKVSRKSFEQKNKEWHSKLTPSQRKAFDRYTMDQDAGGTFERARMYTAGKLKASNLRPGEKVEFDNLIAGLNKAPKRPATVYRGASMTDAELGDLMRARGMRFDGITSTSKARSVGESFVDTAPGRPNAILYEIQAKQRGVVDVDKFVKNGLAEQEAILMPGGRFRLDKISPGQVDQFGGTYTKITLIEY